MLARACIGVPASLPLRGASSDTFAPAAPLEFGGSSWINLHHFLYRQAVEDSRGRANRDEHATWVHEAWFYSVTAARGTAP